MNMDKITISNLQGESGLVNVVRYFQNNGQEYLIYSLNEVDEAGYTRLYVAKITQENGKYSAETLNDAEWTEVKNLVKVIVKANKEGMPVPVQDIDTTKIANILLKDKKVFKLNAPLVNDLSANKKIVNNNQQPTFEQPVQQPTFEQPVQQPTFDIPMQQPAFEQPVQQPTFDIPMQQPTFEQPVQQPTFDIPMQQPAFEQPVQQPTFDIPMQQPAFEQPVQQPTFDIPMQQPTFEQPVQQQSFNFSDNMNSMSFDTKIMNNPQTQDYQKMYVEEKNKNNDLQEQINKLNTEISKLNEIINNVKSLIEK